MEHLPEGGITMKQAHSRENRAKILADFFQISVTVGEAKEKAPPFISCGGGKKSIPP